MGSTNYLTKPKSGGYRVKSGSSGGSDKDMNGKLKKTKLRRPSKMNEYGGKRIPDYTELAYKEAVSKLRYFLSGNYAPSVRSYGGSPSIKNMDESDGDLDKKYSSSYNTLSEYKPRPRLTAKYTTLYADSLNNYTPHVNNVAPAPVPSVPAGDVTGGTNPDVVNFIQKQEEYIEQLERESQYCRDELNNLLGKVKEVISENEHLHEAQKNKLISRMFHSYNAGSETDELDDVGDSTGLDSDNKVTPSKTRKVSKSRSTRLEGPNIVFESRISELEAQLTQAKIDLKKVQDENNENKRKLASGLVDSTCLDGFKRQIDNLQRDKSSLEAQISKLKLSLEQRDDDGKYRRGSDAVEQQLRDERNNLEAEIRRLKDDLAKERNKIRELAGEGARRAIQERSAAEQRYNAHFDELQHDLAAQYDNVAKMQLDLERQRREENDLKRELSMKNAAIEELKMELKNKTSSLQADLSQANAEKASVEEELASARLAIERHQRQAKHDANRLNSEIQSLRQRLDRADADLVHSRRENLRLTEQISTLEKELNMKNLLPISPEKNKKEKELTTMLESMENKHAKTVAELECMIQSQNSLMEKLTGECRLLTDKLDDANRRHKEELATLQRQVDTLGRTLQIPHTPSTYQAPTTHAAASHRNEPHTPSGTRRNDSGVEPANLSERKISNNGNNHREFTVHQNYGEQSRDVKVSETVAGDVLEPDNLNSEQRYGDVEDLVNNIEVEGNYEIDHIPNVGEVHNITDGDVNKDVNDKPMEVDTFEQENYEQSEPQEANYYQTSTYDNDNIQNEQNFQDDSQAGYQNEYEQHYVQPTYTEGEYANYEQYPQQYNDPNQQYEEQYGNTTDNNYQIEQNYEQTEHTGDSAQFQEHQQDEINASVEIDNNVTKNVEPSQS